jgi:hypothetical protein
MSRGIRVPLRSVASGIALPLAVMAEVLARNCSNAGFMLRVEACASIGVRGRSAVTNLSECHSSTRRVARAASVIVAFCPAWLERQSESIHLQCLLREIEILGAHEA